MLRFQILDLLIDGPASCLALLSGLRRHYGYGLDFTVSRMFDQLLSLQDSGWIRMAQMREDMSFRDADAKDVTRAREAYVDYLTDRRDYDPAVDEIGIWCEVTSAGRQEWMNWKNDNARGAGNQLT